jgi:hypothetical protein
MSALIFKFQDLKKVKQEEESMLSAGYDYLDLLNDLAFEDLFGHPMAKENPARYQALHNLIKKMAPKGCTLPLSNWGLE